jgi:hypothetical protein
MHKQGAEERSPEYDVERAATGEACGTDAQTNAASTGSAAVAGKLPAILEGAPALLKRVATWALMTVLHGVKFFLPDYAYLLLSHRRRIGRFPNLERPKTFNEMILCRCLHPDPQWAELTDKLSVREYVRHKIGEEHLIPLVAVPDTFTQEVFDALPASFVMKANHGCGFVEVVRDKSKTSFEELNQLASQWLATNFYYASRERHYRHIKPRIYFEQVLLDKTGKIPSDLKLHMFGRGPDGRIIYPVVISDRFGDTRCDVYDEQWNWLDLALGDYKRSDTAARPPANWPEIVRIAKLLGEDFGYVRVDLYALDDHVYFGELTFTSGAGVLQFSRDQYDYEWGCLMRATPVASAAVHDLLQRSEKAICDRQGQ